MVRGLLVVFVLGVGCSSEASAERERDTPPQGAAEGDSCGAAADCAPVLRCVGLVCVDEASVGGDGGVASWADPGEEEGEGGEAPGVGERDPGEGAALGGGEGGSGEGGGAEVGEGEVGP